MSNRKALITGTTGQDGSYLCDLLQSKGYEVHGLVRQSTQFTPDKWGHLRNAMNNGLNVHYGDMKDALMMRQLIESIEPDEVYNLAAQSHVGLSFEQPVNTVDVTALGPLNLLEAIRRSGSRARFYEASSSEMFGKVVETPQSEGTPFYPRSPYGCAKVFGHYITQNYREAYGMYACSGILFNHETSLACMPIMFKEGNSDLIDIKPIAEVVQHHTNRGKLSIDEKVLRYQGTTVSNELYVWDFEGWTRVKYASAYPHDRVNEHKHPRMMVTPRGVFAATATHRIIMHDATEKPASNIVVGDRVHIASYPRLPADVLKSTTSKLTLEFARLLGFISGDGHVSSNGGRLTGKDKDLLEQYATIWRTIDSKNTADFWVNTSGFTGKRDIWQVELRGRTELLVRDDLYTQDGKKRVPKHILNANVEIQRAFLEGYNDADGLKKQPAMKFHFKAFKTNSATLAAGLVFLITRVTGQKFCLTARHPKPDEVTKNIIYGISLRSDTTRSQASIRQLRDNIKRLKDEGMTHAEVCAQLGCTNQQVKSRNKFVNDHHFSKPDDVIKQVIDMDDYDGWFYDLETESNTFVCGVGLMHVHNSERRGENFVTRKVTRAVGRIAHGLQKELVLGNTDAKRDWGYAPDYVEAMWLMLQQDVPRDYVIGTGVRHSVQEFVEKAFSHAGLDHNKYVRIDKRFMRPAEVDTLCADWTLAREKLGWSPKVDFDELVKRMVENDMKLAYAELRQRT